jgi:predicted DNA-binding antitoxin AbrB/MazE fold protein
MYEDGIMKPTKNCFKNGERGKEGAMVRVNLIKVQQML